MIRRFFAWLGVCGLTVLVPYVARHGHLAAAGGFWIVGLGLLWTLCRHKEDDPLSAAWLQQHAQDAHKGGIDQSCINWDALTGRERR